MMFEPKNRKHTIKTQFPLLKVGDNALQYVSKFKYLGHIISHNLSDDDDIQREIRSMFTRCNLLIRKFSNCSFNAKLTLFRAFCLCFFDISLWHQYSVGIMHKFYSCYNKCAKLFFGYKKYDSVTNMLLNTGLPSHNTVLHNARYAFQERWQLSSNSLIAKLRVLHSF